MKKKKLVAGLRTKQEVVTCLRCQETAISHLDKTEGLPPRHASTDTSLLPGRFQRGWNTRAYIYFESGPFALLDVSLDIFGAARAQAGWYSPVLLLLGADTLLIVLMGVNSR